MQHLLLLPTRHNGAELSLVCSQPLQLIQAAADLLRELLPGCRRLCHSCLGVLQRCTQMLIFVVHDNTLAPVPEGAVTNNTRCSSRIGSALQAATHRNSSSAGSKFWSIPRQSILTFSDVMYCACQRNVPWICRFDMRHLSLSSLAALTRSMSHSAACTARRSVSAASAVACNAAACASSSAQACLEGRNPGCSRAQPLEHL